MVLFALDMRPILVFPSKVNLRSLSIRFDLPSFYCAHHSPIRVRCRRWLDSQTAVSTLRSKLRPLHNFQMSCPRQQTFFLCLFFTLLTRISRHVFKSWSARQNFILIRCQSSPLKLMEGGRVKLGGITVSMISFFRNVCQFCRFLPFFLWKNGFTVKTRFPCS